jgi:hypothetical protein
MRKTFYTSLGMHPIKCFHAGKNKFKCVSYHKFSGLWLICSYEKNDKNWHWIYPVLALIYFQILQNKKNYAPGNLQL